MEKRLKKFLKSILELIILLVLILILINLLKSNIKIFTSKGNAREKLDIAIQIFTLTDGMKLEEAIKGIEGLEELAINEETGEYRIKIDGQEFYIISQEILEGNSNNI